MDQSPEHSPFHDKTCFIITPISDESSEIRIKAYGLINAVIRPILTEMGFNVKEPLEIASPGSITNHIINQLIDADLVVANLTGPNPNVMYELAVRHATNKPVVTLAEHNTIIPFDIYAERTIRYFDSIAGGEPIKQPLRLAIEASMMVQDQDNPINRAIQRELLTKEIKNEGFESYVLNALDSLLQIANKTFSDFNKPLFPLDFILEIKKLENSDRDIEDLLKSIAFWSPIIFSYEIISRAEDNARIRLASSYSQSEVDLFISNQLRDKFSFSINKLPPGLRLDLGYLNIMGNPIDVLINRKS